VGVVYSIKDPILLHGDPVLPYGRDPALFQFGCELSNGTKCKTVENGNPEEQ